MERFTIEIAKTPAEIVCRYEENRAFLRDYLTDKAPLFTIEPTDDDLRRMQAEFDRMAEAEGDTPHPYSEEFLENNSIHSLLAEKMTEHNVLLMHGSALCMDNEAVIFTAVSGTGKSTHSRLWRENYGERVYMINDDKPMLRFEDGRILVCGTPWDGKHHLSRNVCIPLRAVVSLERDTVNHIEPMAKADAFPVLMKQALTLKKPAVMGRIMKMEKMLLDTVSFYKLGCNMLPEAAVTAHDAIFAR